MSYLTTHPWTLGALIFGGLFAVGCLVIWVSRKHPDIRTESQWRDDQW